jgi:hypothetical protein
MKMPPSTIATIVEVEVEGGKEVEVEAEVEVEKKVEVEVECGGVGEVLGGAGRGIKGAPENSSTNSF